MINFLYCFDSNYNKQAFCSMTSLLNHSSEKINIYIIHKDEVDVNFLPPQVLEANNLNIIKVKKYDKKISNFPNIKNSHVSEATYYRLFVDDYFDNEFNDFIYLDADIICVNDPIKELGRLKKNFDNSDFVLAAKSESKSQKEIQRLSLSSKKYFNAGVIFVNYEMWKRDNVQYKLLNLLESDYDSFLLWDQDLLNKYFDGKYYEISPKFNYVVDLATYIYSNKRKYKNKRIDVKSLKDNNLFIHFAGSHKPWAVDGIMCNVSEIYQEIYRNLFSEKYHIIHKVKKISLIYFSKSILNLGFFKLQFPIHFVKDLYRSLIEY